MDLVEYYLEHIIEDKHVVEIIETLTSNKAKCEFYPDYDNVIFLDDSTMLRCVKEYYLPPNPTRVVINRFGSKNRCRNDCLFIRQVLGCDSSERLSCIECHTNCARLFLEGKIKRKK